jgi:hypothetical protein
LAYARENEAEFREELRTVARFAKAMVKHDVVKRYKEHSQDIFNDIAQPYRSFRDGFFFVPLGIRVTTPPGVGTVIGPPINRPPRLTVLTGFIETDWYHRQLFAVIEYPTFVGRSLLVTPEAEFAQIHFAVKTQAESLTIEHVPRDTEAASYERGWRTASRKLSRMGRSLSAPRTGVGSITLECLHCRMSVTEASEGDVASTHQIPQVFVSTYKTLQQSKRRRRGSQGQSRRSG